MAANTRRHFQLRSFPGRAAVTNIRRRKAGEPVHMAMCGQAVRKTVSPLGRLHLP